MERIAVLTSGGDAPGMNAAIRAVARSALARGWEVLGVQRGFAGLIEDAFVPLDARAVGGVIQRGGTMLGSARSAAFRTPEGQQTALRQVNARGIGAIVVIGGNGSLTGARTLTDVASKGAGGKLVVGGVPASIDNDLACTSMSIGVDTAMNTIVEACDRIFDTATAHKRTFIVEVMGRDCGYLAMTAGIAAGADAVLVPEAGKDEAQIVDQVVRTMQRAYGPQPAGSEVKRRVLVIKSEGVRIESTKLKDMVEEKIKTLLPDVDTRVTVLGHVVRGGTPTAFDRLLAARLANAAIRAMAAGQTDFMAGWSGPGIAKPPCPWDPYVVLSPLDEVLAETAKLMSGDSPLAQWRKKVFQEVEGILQR